MNSYIVRELKAHAPFTFLGALSGLLIMFLSFKISHDISYNIFYVLHPMHVVLSALVTASMYELHTCKRVAGTCMRGSCNFWLLLVVGYIGSVGIATLSDAVIPYLGETLLGMPNREMHIGFIEKWWLVNPLAILGVTIAYFNPTTKYPHGIHVLLSTWASLFHILMARGESFAWYMYGVILLFLFLAVWIPCCVSDIVFPLLFVNRRKNKPCEQ
jgi:hypothetical protein